MCGIGLTVLETPPHAVISIADGSPLARSHQVLQGDILIAIEDELVADATMVV
jgi:C-terminal processing protease CtpA/Prc